jgi:hypothetical protein
VKRIAIAFEGLTLAGELHEERAPRLCQAIWESLPLEGQVTNVTWSGEMLRLWVRIPEPPEPENVVALQNPGDILYVPGWNGLRLVYGPSQFRGPRGPHPVPRVGRLLGDLGDFARAAKRVEWDGAKPMRVTRA